MEDDHITSPPHLYCECPAEPLLRSPALLPPLPHVASGELSPYCRPQGRSAQSSRAWVAQALPPSPSPGSPPSPTLTNALLGSLVISATFVTLCNAQCYVIPLENITGESTTECKDGSGVTHPLNSRWKTEKCEECSCSTNGIQCCNTLNKETCSYTVVELENPEKSCVVSAWVM
ncbi:beta-microseminoprotein [Trichechus manatus latirostris]|uniref:Beta-microseminoprotein n=1 Tax=Trichechus manatus latirostris TaxID=127582 RepID=A0A2Y9E6H1_TRIMA|nr:beta-microseminoprotein [Trichechus manatus latirostris]